MRPGLTWRRTAIDCVYSIRRNHSGGRMAKIAKVSEADLRKRILAVEAQQLKTSAVLQPDRAARSRLQKSRAAAGKMMSRWMTGGGVEIDKLRSTHEARESELARLVDAHKRDALAQAAKRSEERRVGKEGRCRWAA